MEANTPPFREKEFLAAMLSMIEEEYGSELRYIFDRRFSGVDIEIAKRIPSLRDKLDDILIKKFVSEWFKEAKTRRLVNQPTTDVSFCISTQGYEKAIRNRDRLKYFWREHWKYIVTTSLAFLVAIIGVLRFIGC
jgi:hypothetical protein